MSLRSIVLFLINEIRTDFIHDVYDKYIANLMRVTAMNKKIEDDNANSWGEIYESIIGVDKVEYAPAKSVIEEVMARHGIKYAETNEPNKTE